MSTYMSASEYVGIFANTRKNVLTYMSACFSRLVECADISMCRHMSTSWGVDIYVGISTCQHICQHKNKCADTYIGIFLTSSRMCRHLNVLTYMPAYLFLCWPDADRYADTSRCWLIYIHIYVYIYIFMPTRWDVGTFYYAHIFRCRHICQHIKMMTQVPAHWDADIFFL